MHTAKDVYVHTSRSYPNNILQQRTTSSCNGFQEELDTAEPVCLWELLQRCADIEQNPRRAELDTGQELAIHYAIDFQVSVIQTLSAMLHLPQVNQKQGLCSRLKSIRQQKC